MKPHSFDELYITHIGIVADIVQPRNTFIDNTLELFYGIKYCIVRNQHYIGKVKSEFLKLWLR